MIRKGLSFAVCMLVPFAIHAAEKLNVKPGLWEITSSSSISGVPPLPKDVLDKLTPEQRAEMEAAFKDEASKGPQVDVDRECVTKDEIDRPFQPADAEDCTHTLTQSTRTTQEVKLVCSGEYEGSGVFRVTASTPETISGSLDLQLGEGKDVMRVKSQIKGRWLGPDCGSSADSDEDEDGRFEDEDESDR
jgi:Protein of unknown function (DUF3617)